MLHHLFYRISMGLDHWSKSTILISLKPHHFICLFLSPPYSFSLHLSVRPHHGLTKKQSICRHITSSILLNHRLVHHHKKPDVAQGWSLMQALSPPSTLSHLCHSRLPHTEWLYLSTFPQDKIMQKYCWHILRCDVHLYWINVSIGSYLAN